MKQVILTLAFIVVLISLTACAVKKLRIYEKEDCIQSLNGQWVCAE